MQLKSIFKRLLYKIYIYFLKDKFCTMAIVLYKPMPQNLKQPNSNILLQDGLQFHKPILVNKSHNEYQPFYAGQRNAQ